MALITTFRSNEVRHKWCHGNVSSFGRLKLPGQSSKHKTYDQITPKPHLRHVTSSPIVCEQFIMIGSSIDLALQSEITVLP